MRWGFGWELGPFETWAPSASTRIAARVEPRRGSDRFRDGSRRPAPIRCSAARSATVVKKNAGASLVDLGDGVLGVEFHSKMNAIGGDTIQMLHAGVKEAAANFRALVVGNDAPNFSAGANLMLLLLEAQEGNWDEVDLMVRAFQGATMALKYADVPVVVAPAGLALGGGCEIVLHADRVQAAAETYIGLVEVGVGLIPAGGGTKEMLARAMDAVPAGADRCRTCSACSRRLASPRSRRAGPTRSGSAICATRDAITMNRDRLLADAKARRARARRRLRAAAAARRRSASAASGVLAALKLGVHLAWRAGRISDHDALIGRKLAWILAGGDAAARDDASPNSSCWISSARRFSACAASGRRRSGSPTR